MDGRGGTWRVPGYTEVRELGEGASGRVILARRIGDDFPVAIKYLSERLLGDPGFLAGFRHEAQLLAIMRSPHAARLYEYVEGPGGAAIVMEPVDGVPLRTLLRAEGPTGPEAALVVLKGALLGLAAAHVNGLVHRDFKPENVIVNLAGESKLVDFGIAVRAGDEVGGAGTPAYMAPEQWAGAPASPSTDVYAATVVFFECLTGAQPFQGTHIATVARHHQTAPPPVEQVPEPLRRLVERGMAKHPADRPPSADAFLAELEAVAAAYGPDWEDRGRRRLASLAGLFGMTAPFAEEPADANTSLAQTRLHRARPARKPSGKMVVGAGVAVAVLAGVAVLFATVGDEKPDLRAQSAIGSPTPTLTAGPEESAEPDPFASEEPTPEDTSPPPTTNPATGPTTGPTGAPVTAPTGAGGRRPTTAPKGDRPTGRQASAQPTARPTEEPEESLTGNGSGGSGGSASRPGTATTTARPSSTPPPAPQSSGSPRPRITLPTQSERPSAAGGGGGGACAAAAAGGCPDDTPIAETFDPPTPR